MPLGVLEREFVLFDLTDLFFTWARHTILPARPCSKIESNNVQGTLTTFVYRLFNQYL